MNAITTSIFVVLDEANLTTLKKYDPEKNDMVTATFSSYDHANEHAASYLELWTVVPVKFEHAVHHHIPNVMREEG